MRKHTVTGKSLVINSGLVGLTKDQARRRRHLLVDTDVEGIYSLKAAINFKAGEEFTHDGDLAKVPGVDVFFTPEEITEREAERQKKRAVSGRDTAGLAQPKIAVTVSEPEPDKIDTDGTDESTDSPGSEEDAGDASDTDDPDTGDAYTGKEWDREALKNECALRGITHGNAVKDDSLRALLIEDDLTRPD